MPGRPAQKRLRAAAVLLPALLLAGAFLSCRTAPDVLMPPAGPAAFLPEGRLIYACARAGENRELLRLLLDRFDIRTQGVRYLADNARTLYLAALPELVIVAEGGFSRGLIDLGLGMDKNWKKIERSAGGRKVEVWRGAELSLVIPSDELVVAWSSPPGDPGQGEPNGAIETAMLERLYGRPAEAVLSAAALRALMDHDIAAYAPIVDGGLFQGARADGGAESPLRHAFLYLDRAGGAVYELSGLLAAAEGRDPRILNVLVRLGLSGWLASLEVKDLKTIQSELVLGQDGSNVSLRGLKFSSEELAELAMRIARPAGAPAPAGNKP